MRNYILLPVLALIATPAVARDRDAPPPQQPPLDARAAANALNNPMVQNGVVGLIDALTDAVMETRVGPMAAIAPNSDIRPNDTLDSMAARRNPYYRDDIHRDAKETMATAGRTARAAAAMSDELQATAARVRRVLGTANPN
ncbi:MAG: hypothetical protein ACTHJR_08355 [Sphingomonas sp.]|uniref:hypothetical protein n=1 Tax=Sphingomonas sp. TaxID=28214 RepID=UPI003F7DFDEB